MRRLARAALGADSVAGAESEGRDVFRHRVDLRVHVERARYVPDDTAEYRASREVDDQVWQVRRGVWVHRSNANGGVVDGLGVKSDIEGRVEPGQSATDVGGEMTVQERRAERSLDAEHRGVERVFGRLRAIARGRCVRELQGGLWAGDRSRDMSERALRAEPEREVRAGKADDPVCIRECEAADIDIRLCDGNRRVVARLDSKTKWQPDGDPRSREDRRERRVLAFGEIAHAGLSQ